MILTLLGRQLRLGPGAPAVSVSRHILVTSQSNGAAESLETHLALVRCVRINDSSWNVSHHILMSSQRNSIVEGLAAHCAFESVARSIMSTASASRSLSTLARTRGSETMIVLGKV